MEGLNTGLARAPLQVTRDQGESGHNQWGRKGFLTNEDVD